MSVTDAEWTPRGWQCVACCGIVSRSWDADLKAVRQARPTECPDCDARIVGWVTKGATARGGGPMTAPQNTTPPEPAPPAHPESAARGRSPEPGALREAEDSSRTEGTSPASAQIAPRCIASPRLDGHTRARATFDPVRWCGELADKLRELAQPRTQEEARQEKRKGISIRLPNRLYADVRVGGAFRESIALHLRDIAHYRVHLGTGEIEVQAKARYLWGDTDQRAAVCDLLCEFTGWILGERPTPDQLHSLGWNMTGVELCADFTDCPIAGIDPATWVGRGGRGELSRPEPFLDKDTADVWLSYEGNVETVSYGRRTSRVSWCIYDKTGQIRRSGDDSRWAIYDGAWKARGWKGEEVSRVELRLNGDGLELTSEDRSELISLRDPAQLTDSNLRRVWAALCTKYRMVDLASATRRERCKMLEHWRAIVDAAEVPAEELRQARTIKAGTWERRVKRAARDASCALRRLAALHNANPGTGRAIETLARMADAISSPDKDLPEYHDHYHRTHRHTIPDDAAEDLQRRLGNAWREFGWLQEIEGERFWCVDSAALLPSRHEATATRQRPRDRGDPAQPRASTHAADR